MNPTNEELALAFQQGDSKALDCLWEANQGLFSMLCFKYYRKFGDVCQRCGVQLEDLQQETFLALREAAQSFNIAKGKKFSTWVGWYVKSHFLGLCGLRGGKRPLNGAVSLDLPVGEEQEESLEDFQSDPSAEEAFDQAEQSIYQQQLHDALEAELDTLLGECAEVIRRMYFDGETRKEIARQMGCKEDRVYRLRQKALQQLHRKSRLQRFLQDTSFGYTGVSFSSWEHGGSVQERLVERLDPLSKRVYNK